MNEKIATIVPKHHLPLIENDRYFMALVHAAAADKDYFNFFKARAEEGKYVILDNSTVELGHPFNTEAYVQIATEMKASEICLPDWLHEKDRTIAEDRAAIKLIKSINPKINLMAIPQGKTKAEWYACADAMMKMKINTIGVSCRYTEMFVNRVLGFLPIRNEIKRAGLKIHLLGNYLDPEVEIAQAVLFPEVRGVDSSTPCVYTRVGLRLADGQPSPPHHKLDFINDRYDEALLIENIAEWQKRSQRWFAN